MACTCELLAHQPETDPTPPAVEAWSLNHWTTRDVRLFVEIHLQLVCLSHMFFLHQLSYSIWESSHTVRRLPLSH